MLACTIPPPAKNILLLPLEIIKACWECFWSGDFLLFALLVCRFPLFHNQALSPAPPLRKEKWRDTEFFFLYETTEVNHVGLRQVQDCRFIAFEGLKQSSLCRDYLWMSLCMRWAKSEQLSWLRFTVASHYAQREPADFSSLHCLLFLLKSFNPGATLLPTLMKMIQYMEILKSHKKEL